jgi:hypothetical protein
MKEHESALRQAAGQLITGWQQADIITGWVRTGKNPGRVADALTRMIITVKAAVVTLEQVQLAAAEEAGRRPGSPHGLVIHVRNDSADGRAVERAQAEMRRWHDRGYSVASVPEDGRDHPYSQVCVACSGLEPRPFSPQFEALYDTFLSSGAWQRMTWEAWLIRQAAAGLTQDRMAEKLAAMETPPQQREERP